MTPDEILRAFGQMGLFDGLGTTSGTGTYGAQTPPRHDRRTPIGRGVHGEPVYEAEVISITTEKEST